MNTQSIENILHQAASSEQLIQIATVILIAAAVIFVLGLLFKAIRLVCILVALVVCLSSLGFFTKAQNALEEKLGVEIPVTQIREVIDELRSGADLQAVLDELAAQMK